METEHGRSHGGPLMFEGYIVAGRKIRTKWARPYNVPQNIQRSLRDRFVERRGDEEKHPRCPNHVQ